MPLTRTLEKEPVVVHEIEKKPEMEDRLIQNAVQGGLESFNRLILTHQRMAYDLANAILGDTDQAEDVTQESFLKAYLHMGNFRGGSFRAWLARIVKNTCYDLLRRYRRNPVQSLYPPEGDDKDIEFDDWLSDPGPSVQLVVEQKEESRAIYRALSELPDPYRMVITLIDLQGFDYLEAAEALSIPLGTVKSRLTRARLQMKEKLGSLLPSQKELPGMDEKAAAFSHFAQSTG